CLGAQLPLLLGVGTLALNASVSDIEEPSKLGTLGCRRGGALARRPLRHSHLDQLGLERGDLVAGNPLGVAGPLLGPVGAGAFIVESLIRSALGCAGGVAFLFQLDSAL